ncbi:Acetylxylan esterase [Diplonema papillatum]|nr:Acetylxylan esterase [Diplonema papillatum]KAJ9460192.1 Acetylxylan esterase [Diplonema papillatum]
MAATRAVLFAAAWAAAGAHDGLPVNPLLSVPGYPNCKQPLTEGGNEFTLECFQEAKDRADQISVGCVGDSITAGVHSTGGNATYPAQLGILLGDGYKVTNLGACGATMMKSADSPYWDRPQYTTLVNNTWDIIIIMLGTNDAKDTTDSGPGNWPHNCTGPNALACPYAVDYAEMISVVRTLGTTEAGPDIFLAIPPPLMKDAAYGMNATVINEVFPVLIPAINAANNVTNAPIDVFSAFAGGEYKTFPPGGCTLNTSDVADCRYYCDTQSCDQCHPNNNGYAHMAAVMKQGLGL